jgi:CDP-alcohol phosphatidyltransferase
MFDARFRPLIDPPLNAAGRWLAARGLSANALTIMGLIVGLAAAVAISRRAYALAVALIIVNRILDGLDGAVARVRGPSDFGGYLDSLCDFAFYVAVPLGFALATPGNPDRQFHPHRRQLPCLRRNCRQARAGNQRARKKELFLLDRHRRGSRDDCGVRADVRAAFGLCSNFLCLYGAVLADRGPTQLVGRAQLQIR